ncbi:TPA: hypothetical protein I7730_15755 [Vibrio vulnificus]|uniref:Uncharacterized protein n=1 Tax=Vibrio vulnificus TaxID=672 RepID=A0A8H9TG12_VIBVL|nr:hypothetical protein [Vibrio vulnificus]
MQSQLLSVLKQILDVAKAATTPDFFLNANKHEMELDIKTSFHIYYINNEVEFDINCNQITYIFKDPNGLITVRLNPEELPEFELEIEYMNNTATIKLYGQDRWVLTKIVLEM